MNLTHIRVLLYFLAPMAGLIPGVTFISDAGQIVIDLEAAAIGLAAAGAVAAGVFRKWGKT